MLTAKAEETSLISSWHYFCASVSSLSVYLTGNDNIYPISELLILRHKAQGTGCGSTCITLRSELKECNWFENW
jgi:hypothetical protein